MLANVMAGDPGGRIGPQLSRTKKDAAPSAARLRNARYGAPKRMPHPAGTHGSAPQMTASAPAANATGPFTRCQRCLSAATGAALATASVMSLSHHEADPEDEREQHEEEHRRDRDHDRRMAQGRRVPVGRHILDRAVD